MKKINVFVLVLPGQAVMVRNYRASLRWERGEVRSVKAGIDKDGSAIVSYSVWVARIPKGPRSRTGYFLTVGHTSILKIKK